MAMKGMRLSMLAAAIVLGLGVCAMAAEAAKTVSGKSNCGGCSGVVDGCCVMLTDAEGVRWILRGDNESLKAAFKVRHSGKSMTAKIEGDATAKKGKDGKDYKEVKATEVKIAS
jgi:hypothetical protein